MPFIKSVFISFTIWVMTALLNGMLSGSWLALASGGSGSGLKMFFGVFAGTLFLSIPGMFIFWIVLLINRDADALFRYLLKTGFLTSAISCLILFLIPAMVIDGHRLFLAFATVTAIITSIMMHHRVIVKLFSKKL